MGDKTGISWTDTTWNPIRGCSRVSEGCRHCYAERVAARFSGPGMPYEGLVRMGKRSRGIGATGPMERVPLGWNGEVRMVPEHLADPLRWRKPRRVFVNSMSDLFHEKLSNEQIAAVFGVMAAAPQHTFQVLTKRAERMRDVLNDLTFRALVETMMHVALAGRIEEYFAPEREQDIADYPGYVITSRGRVISYKRGADREMAIQYGEQGHGRVMLYRDGVEERVLVHRLVLDAFDRPGRENEQACHIDGNPRNNALWNLRWGSQAENWKDRKRHGNRRSHSKLTEEQVETIRSRCRAGESAYAVAKDFGISDTQARNIVAGRQWAPEQAFTWPLPSVWLGVSVENQDAADERITLLLDTPAAVRFLSCEPLLGSINLERYLWRAPTSAEFKEYLREAGGSRTMISVRSERLGWIIAGCESGPGARPADVAWFRSLRDQCAAAGVPFFLKQAVENVWRIEDEDPPSAGGGFDPNRILSPVTLGDGSKMKPGRVIELPYLDGVQHAALPEVRHG